MKPWSIAHLDKLKAEGKIKGYSVQTRKKEVETPNGRIVTKAFRKPTSKAKEWIEKNLLYWCSAKGYTVIEEYRFNPERKWRSDWYIPQLNCLLEFEGGVFQQNGGHNSVKDYTKDLNKYNSAIQLGFRLIRLNAINYKSLLTELNNLTLTHNRF